MSYFVSPRPPNSRRLPGNQWGPQRPGQCPWWSRGIWRVCWPIRSQLIHWKGLEGMLTNQISVQYWEGVWKVCWPIRGAKRGETATMLCSLRPGFLYVCFICSCFICSCFFSACFSLDVPTSGPYMLTTTTFNPHLLRLSGGCAGGPGFQVLSCFSVAGRYMVTGFGYSLAFRWLGYISIGAL